MDAATKKILSKGAARQPLRGSDSSSSHNKAAEAVGQEEEAAGAVNQEGPPSSEQEFLLPQLTPAVSFRSLAADQAVEQEQLELARKKSSV